MEFIDRINQLCKERKISKRQLEREAGLGAGSSSKWKTFTPNNTTMTKLANYFGVSISYLTGESEYKSEQEAMWDAQYNSKALSDESTRIEKGCRIPVLGQVVAGIPIEAIEEVLDWEEIPFRLAQTGEFFGLQVKGDSMSPRMQAGDVLIVKQQSDAESGDIVIAQVNGDSACVKKLLKQDDGIVLQSFNPTYAPMYFSNKDIIEKPVQIIGRVIDMSMRFRKTIKLGKGVNLNFNKNSVGISVGSKAGRITVNSKGRKTTTMHTPIKGVSFVNTQSSSNKTSSEAVYVPPKEKKELKTSKGMMIATIFLGWLGVQRYASGQIGLGILYTLTFGLFGIGWIYDIYKEIKFVLF